jgi:hypothetical protein
MSSSPTPTVLTRENWAKIRRRRLGYFAVAMIALAVFMIDALGPRSTFVDYFAIEGVAAAVLAFCGFSLIADSKRLRALYSGAYQDFRPPS